MAFALFCNLTNTFLTHHDGHVDLFCKLTNGNRTVCFQSTITREYLICDTNDIISTHIRLDPNEASEWTLVNNTTNVYQCVGLESCHIIALTSLPNSYMQLNLCVQDCDQELQKMYVKRANEHNQHTLTHINEYNAGFDLIVPNSYNGHNNNNGNFQQTIDFKVSSNAQIHTLCSNTLFPSGTVDNQVNNYAITSTAYYLYPRSSIVNSNLRLANSQGIIDAGYRGHLKAVFDVTEGGSHIHTFQRVVQVCSPNLMPLLVRIVYDKSQLGETLRGDGGFGSTGTKG